MRNIFVKIVACLAVVLVTTPSSASVMKRSKNQDSDDVFSEIGIGQGYPLSEEDSTAGFLQSAMTDPTALEDYTLSITASFLWWNVSQEQMLLAFRNNASGAEGYLEQKAQYGPAFNVALTGYLWQDGWMGSVMYTRMQNTSKSSFSGSNLYANTGWIHPDYVQNDIRASTINTGNTALLGGGMTSDWDTNLDKIDFRISRSYYCGRSLIITSYSGVCLAWIEQDMSVRAILDATSDATTTATTTTTTLNSQSWLVGPSLQCDFKWLIGYGIRFTGSAGGTIYFQNFIIDIDYATAATSPLSAITDGTARVAPAPTSIAINDKQDATNVHCMGSMGLGWGSYIFEEDACNVDLSLSYEFNYWFGQNVLRKAISESRDANDFAVLATDVPQNVSTHATAPGALRYHGITLTLRIDF